MFRACLSIPLIGRPLRDLLRLSSAVLHLCPRRPPSTFASSVYPFLMSIGHRLVQQPCDAFGGAEGDLIEGVREAVARLVGIIQTYQSKNRLAKVLTSTLLKRRLEEADRAIDRAINRYSILQVRRDFFTTRGG